jgi:hypothetical protein
MTRTVQSSGNGLYMIIFKCMWTLERGKGGASYFYLWLASDIFIVIKSRGREATHVIRMGEMCNAFNISIGKTAGKKTWER